MEASGGGPVASLPANGERYGIQQRWVDRHLESGYFFIMPKVNLRPLAELFRAHVIKMLKKERLIDDAFIKMIFEVAAHLGLQCP